MVVAVLCVSGVSLWAQPAGTAEVTQARVEARTVKAWPIRGDWTPVQAVLDERAAQEAAEAVRVTEEAAEAERQAQEALRAAQRVSAPVQVSAPAPPLDCYGVNWMAADIYFHESGCNPGSVNKGGCAGIGQACPGSKLPCSLEDAPCQLAYFEAYMLGRYGSWEAAYHFRNANNWW